MDKIYDVARALTFWEQESRNLKWPDARDSVARQAGIAPSALERLEKRQLKHIERVAGPLDALLIAKVEQQIASLERAKALAVARANARNQPAPDVAGIEAALATARRLIARG